MIPDPFLLPPHAASPTASTLTTEEPASSATCSIALENACNIVAAVPADPVVVAVVVLAVLLLTF